MSMRGRVSFREAGTGRHASANPSSRAVPLDDLSGNLIRFTILLVPVNWICGTTPLWLYAVALVLLFRTTSVSILELLFAWLLAAFVLGLGIGLWRGAPMDRGLASIYNMTILLVLVAFLNAGRSLAEPARDAVRAKVFRAAWLLFCFNAAFILAVFVVTKATGQYAVPVRTLVLGLLGHLPGVLGEYGEVDVSVIDWTVGGPETRVIGFGIYATEGALIFLLAGLLAAVDAQHRHKPWRWVGIELGTIVGLIIMASRTTLLAYLISALLLVALQPGRLAKLGLLAAPVILVGSLLIGLYGGDVIGHWLTVQNDSRLGSSDTRFLSYTTAIAMVLDQNPFTGLGIKPLIPDFIQIPIGSHSTLTSTFIKGGFVALAVLATLYLTLAAGIVRAQLTIWMAPLARLDMARRIELLQLARCVVVILVWWVTEDFDAPAHEAALAGTCFGLFWGCMGRYGNQY